MAVQKRKALLLSGCLLMSMLLSGCGGIPLSEREIVRAIFLDKQGMEYSLCLLLANHDTQKGEGEPYKTVAATGATPALALANAEANVQGTPYYGLLDLAALPAAADWTDVQQAGALLYDKAQPAPEISIFMLPNAADIHWAKDAGGLYDGMKAREKSAQLHCGLQQLFAQQNVCSLPVYRPDGYGFMVLVKGQPAAYCEDELTASFAASLAGQAKAIQGRFAGGRAECSAKVTISVVGRSVELQLRQLRVTALQGKASEETLKKLLAAELQLQFEALASLQGDPFRFQFWQASRWGNDTPLLRPTLTVSFA